MKNNIIINTQNDLYLLHYQFSNGEKDLCELQHIPNLIAKSRGVSRICKMQSTGSWKIITFKKLNELFSINKIDTSSINHLKQFSTIYE